MSQPSPKSGEQRALYRRRERPIGKPSRFFGERCRDAVEDDEWTSDKILWAHYRRWAFLSDLRTVKAASFQAAIKQQVDGTEPIVVNGHRLWPIHLGDREVERQKFEDRDRERSKQLRGRVRIVEELLFFQDGDPTPLTIGTELDWHVANKAEERDQVELFQRQVHNKVASPVPYIVVMWKGRRRLIPSSACRATWRA